MVERILLIGGSANDFGQETEGDAASFQVADTLLARKYEVFIIDDNPFSFTLGRHDIVAIQTEVTTNNILQAITDYNITAIFPTVGGLTAIRLVEEVVEILGDNAPKILGIRPVLMGAVQNSKILQERLAQLKQPVIKTRLASNMEEVFDAARDFEFPVVVRPVAPMGQTLRLQIESADELEAAAERALARSLTKQVNIDQSIAGYQEISLVVVRDRHDTMLVVGGIEDLDPVGIHTADSIAVTPIQTLPDPLYQRLRQTAFILARGFEVTGVLEVRFAVAKDSERYVVTRITPYYDRGAALVTTATGYPLVPVMTGLMLGETLEKTQIPSNYAKYTALIEPSMDHIVMRFPVFPFDELEESGQTAQHRLDTVQKSVGATIGVGRSLEEALEKSLRAAHFSNRSFSPTVMNALSDNEIIEQLIYPRDNRILVLLEALKRGYTVDELAELTKIDAFYFYKLRNIMQLERAVSENVFNADVLKDAKYYGLSDGLIARLWRDTYPNIRRYRWDNGILPTYKAFEPSAGEFEEAVSQFYSTFETENETTRLGTDSALVIGAGAFRLGDGAAASNVMASVAEELGNNQIKTIIMNNNPHDLTAIPRLADKHYFEPLEISDVMNVIEVEQPTRVFVPGNRIKLISSLREMGIRVKVIAKDKYLPASVLGDGEQTVINYFYDGKDLHIIAIGHQDNQGIMLDQNALTQHLLDTLPKPKLTIVTPGMYQLIVDRLPIERTITADDIRPMPFMHLNFMEKVTGVSWIRMVVRFMIERVTEADYELLAHWLDHAWPMPTATLRYAKADMIGHLKISGELDNGPFAMGARYYALKNDEVK
ncbi:carbamoylphosphate synthase large subunit [Weissella oryzae SG25]|uniref:carbamoyl-phosphate synthase (ammonia) n=1 Tax=Weissella oryzae (strain DSM 25784 / JCM 18191 / LMG 30913 / SG25) TaxID=1329250 RepID=A0A069CW24_WEIOS|nr:hypothetical protein [Weissella oryzae]GAK31669.1 carbamoylphosphate synthase large subunit [Weissella oryzae SG25]